jgi:D-sedoheptulose 7-phosphate isomerase
MNWKSQVQKISELLNSLIITDQNHKIISVDSGFDRLKELSLEVKTNNNTIYFIGNGASASMASHCAADLVKNARIHTKVFSDLSLITAISNDSGYENVFAEPLKVRGEEGDMVIAISSSGNSPNIIKAAEIAKAKKINFITLTAMLPDNKVRQLGDLNIYIAAKTYGNAESCHAAILHYWMDHIIE